MVIQGALWGLLIAVCLVVLIVIGTSWSVCKKDWRAHLSILKDVLTDKTSGIRKVTISLLLWGVAHGAVVGLYLTGGKWKAAAVVGLAMFMIASLGYTTWRTYQSVRWNFGMYRSFWNLRNAVPQAKSQDQTIRACIYVISMLCSCFYAWLGLYSAFV